MKPSALAIATALLLTSQAAAQSDPFQRSVPAQVTPSLKTNSAPAAPLTLTGVQNQSFGNPRSSSDGATTRVVFDLPSGVTYSLTPTFTGLRIDVQGARVLPAVMGRMGASVSEYRASGGQVNLTTPFPLALKDGWRASEATIANGNRVLIVEFGSTLSGGAAASVRGKVQAAAPASAAVQSSVSAPVPTGNVVASMPPGDTIRTGPVLPPAPSLPDSDVSKPNALSGKAAGRLQAGASLGAPRIGKNPGMTRIVLDLPAGTSYRVIPGGLGLRVELKGVSVSSDLSQQDVTPEVRAWRLDGAAGGVNATFITASPTTERGGWRAQLLPPVDGSTLSRLAIDFSPAIADLSPVPARDKLLGAVPPVPATKGTAMLALSANYVKPCVVLDPGHGGVDPGAVGTIVEKQVTLAVALRVRDLLQAAGVDVLMTRDRDTQLSTDKVRDLNMRAALGTTTNSQMYVSIHVNAMPAQNALRGYGIETWWNPNHPLSQSLAGVLQRNMIQTTSGYSQGLKNNRSLAVLRGSRIPAALVEVGYTSHPVDGVNLQDSNYLDRVALGIASGIREALVTGITASGAVQGSVGGGDR